MPRVFCAAIAFSVVTGLAAPAAKVHAQAQQPASPQSPQLVPRTSETREQAYLAHRLIEPRVVVRDASGANIAGIKPDDFTVLDHGQPAKIATFQEVNSPASSPTHGLLILDAINNGRPDVERVRKEFLKLLGQGTGPLPVPLGLAVVSNSGTREGKPTTDRNVLIAELTKLPGDLQGLDCGEVVSSQGRWNCMNVHFFRSLNALNGLAEQQQKANGPAIFIWTGPGWPLPPEITTGQIMPGGGTSGNLSGAIIALESAMQLGRVTLDAATWGKFERAAGVRRAGLHGPLPNASLPEQEAAIQLPALVEQTGGLALEKSKSLVDALSACLLEGEHYYSIAFDPAPAAAPDEYRSIEVKVDRPGATVRTLTGYYAQP